MAKAELEAAIERLQLTVDSEFIPFSKSRNAAPSKANGNKPWRSLNWNVTLKHAGRDVLTTQYSAGEAHAPSFKQRLTVDEKQCLDYELEHGHRAMLLQSTGTISRGKPIKPDTCDVIYSLVNDADVLNCATFEEWAGDCGYDPDSRAGEATYRACLDTALKLRNALGEAGLQELHEATQDY